VSLSANIAGLSKQLPLEKIAGPIFIIFAINLGSRARRPCTTLSADQVLSPDWIAQNHDECPKGKST
jgi:hypothetical protein